MTRWPFVVVMCACVAMVGAARTRPSPVAVRRCCPTGQYLRVDASGAWSCITDAAADSDRWTPRIYAPALRTFLPPTTVPAHWNVTVGPPSCATARAHRDDETVPYMAFANNGSLLMRRVGVTVGADEWCGDSRATLVCLERTKPRAPKCCPADEAFSADEKRCRPSALAATAVIALRELRGDDEPQQQLGGGWPACDGGSYGLVGVLGGAVLDDDGALRLLSGSIMEAGGWCAEAVLGQNESAVLACVGGEEAAGGGVRHVLYGCGLAVGACFLLATLVASRLLPAQHHALHGRCQSRYLFTLMLGDALLAVTQLAAGSVPPVPCKVLAVCMHFLFLSAFFWLNTMCFNIWWTFRDFRPTSLERGQEARRLRLYRAYAWGAPLVLAGAAAVMDAVPGALSPRFAERRCWFYGDTELLVYFFGPVGALLLVNLALFLSTARQLTCGLWRRDDLKASSERAALGRVCAKLLVVMGVSWGADVISWAAGGPHALWYATDLLNALQGVLVFLVVGCRAPVLSACSRALSRMCPRLWLEPPAAPPAPTSCGDSLTHTTAATAPPHNSTQQPTETVC